MIIIEYTNENNQTRYETANDYDTAVRTAVESYLDDEYITAIWSAYSIPTTTEGVLDEQDNWTVEYADGSTKEYFETFHDVCELAVMNEEDIIEIR